MDKRKKYLLGIDTETCNGLMVDDKLDLSQSIVYDIGWAIVDKSGKVYKTQSFVVYEVFCGMKDVMASAFYAEKIPQYWEEIKQKKRKLATLYTIRKALINDIKEYGIKVAFAHNAPFDKKALNNTIRYVTKSKYRWFFYNIEFWDTLTMARQTIANQKGYQTYCKEKGFMTNHKIPRVRLTAEILYKYISGDDEFLESHTGLEDVLIETQILSHCLRQHKKINWQE